MNAPVFGDLSGKVALVIGGSRGFPEEPVGAAPVLASDASSSMTGQALVIDGGILR